MIKVTLPLTQYVSLQEDRAELVCMVNILTSDNKRLEDELDALLAERCDLIIAARDPKGVPACTRRCHK